MAHTPTPSPDADAPAPAAEQGLTRRQAIGKIGDRVRWLLGAAGVVSMIRPDRAPRPSKPKIETGHGAAYEATKEEALRSALTVEADGSYLRTTAEALAEYTISSLLGEALETAGVKVGNQSMKPLFGASLRPEGRSPLLHRAAYHGAALVGAPIAEEAIFRLYPVMRWIAAHDVGDHWDLGLATSLAFAYIHNIRPLHPALPVPVKFELTSVPIHQFCLGLYTWYAMRRRGFSHAVLAHAMHNSASAWGNLSKPEVKPGFSDVHDPPGPVEAAGG